MSMIPEFSFLPPEINSARIFAGAGSGPLFLAAEAWNSLAASLALGKKSLGMPAPKSGIKR